MPLLSSTRQDLHMVSYADMITDSDSPATTFNMAAQDVMVFLHIQKTGGDAALKIFTICFPAKEQNSVLIELYESISFVWYQMPNC